MRAAHARRPGAGAFHGDAALRAVASGEGRRHSRGVRSFGRGRESGRGGGVSATGASADAAAAGWSVCSVRSAAPLPFALAEYVPVSSAPSPSEPVSSEPVSSEPVSSLGGGEEIEKGRAWRVRGDWGGNGLEVAERVGVWEGCSVYLALPVRILGVWVWVGCGGLPSAPGENPRRGACKLKL